MSKLAKKEKKKVMWPALLFSGYLIFIGGLILCFREEIVCFLLGLTIWSAGISLLTMLIYMLKSRNGEWRFWGRPSI